jgi:hypothetical protein
VELQTASRKARSPSAHTTQVAGHHAPGGRVRAYGPALALVAVVALAAIVYGAAAQRTDMPRVNPDELDYTLAAQALDHGGWLSVRGQGYAFGPVYPLVLAPSLALAGNVDSAYPLFKLANAVLFALAAVPVFFLARRLLSPWWSVAVAAVSVAIPSSIYTSLVTTESTAYLASSVALLALVLALERPSVRRQLALLAAVALATATRPQFAALLAAFLGAYLLLWAIDLRRPRLLHALGRLWPTLGVVSLALAAFALRLALQSASPAELLRGYGVLWRGYDVVSVARLVLYHLAGWELYLFVVPLAVMPIVVAELIRDGRRGGSREGAFAGAFLTVNACFLLVAAAFASTPWGSSELHDRFLFYVAPLWLTGFAVWLSRGLPRPRVWTAVGIVLALVLPALLPFGLIGGNLVFEEVPTALWSWVWTAVHETPHLDGRRVLALTALALAVAAVGVPRRLWPVLPALVVAGLVLTSGFAWSRQADLPTAFVRADDANRDWVDDALPAGSRATQLYLSPKRCPYTELTRHALFLTELFNGSVHRVAALGNSPSDGLPVERVDVGAGGMLHHDDGPPLAAHYVVTQPEIVLKGKRIAQGTGADLVLWKTPGYVRLAGSRSSKRELRRATCA